MDYETATAEQVQERVQEIGRTLANPNRRIGLGECLYELGLALERLEELGVDR